MKRTRHGTRRGRATIAAFLLMTAACAATGPTPEAMTPRPVPAGDFTAADEALRALFLAVEEQRAEIFADLGAPAFRNAEREIVGGLLAVRHAVVATGSGTFVDPVCRARIIADGLVVRLDADFETLVSRLPAGRPRPLGDDRAALKGAYEARGRVYRLADLRLDAGSAGADEVIERLLDWLGF